MPRWMNLILALLIFFPMMIIFLIIVILIKVTSSDPVIHQSTRIGRNNKTFKMPKFRTMKLNTPDVATHLLAEADQFVTPIGKFLRKTSLDEIPQVWSVLKGDMAFVGPRPALYNQDDLIALRTQKGIHQLTPGITGWAQIQGRDELSISKKVEMDFFYLKNRSIYFDLKVIFITVLTVLKLKGVSH
ncbi:MAG: lipid carrier--UDP-N-acetylgalactosaminyltransferase [Nitrosomonadaceae bacterium]|nr:lipid carrier--UDP-N-acetylgalactosaminyltransferase [Nitrosomonadaceae bacterium]